MNPLRWTWNSLHARLLLGAALWIAMALAISDVALSALFRQHVTDQFLHELIDHSSELEGLTHVGPQGVVLLRPLSDPRFSVPDSGFYWEIWRDGRAAVRSPSLAGDDLVPGQARLKIDALAGRRLKTGDAVLMIEREQPAAKMRWVVAADTAQFEAVLGRFARLLRLSLALLAAGLLAAAAGQVFFGLRPMRRVRRALADVRSGRIERLAEDFPSELQPLVSDLNSLIESNREMVRRARAQAGNLAHALKGPLAILSDEAERLSKTGDPAGAAVLRRQCEAMNRQIDHQLARTRAAAAARQGPSAYASVLEAGGEVLAAMTRLYADRPLSFENELGPDLAVGCDPEDLKEIVANLADNAAKWAVARVRLRETPSGDPAMAAFVVEDDGPGIPAAARSEVFAVGARLDERKPGAGLGLAIVRDLVDLYGGRVRLETSDLGGLAAVVELPRPA